MRKDVAPMKRPYQTGIQTGIAAALLSLLLCALSGFLGIIPFFQVFALVFSLVVGVLGGLLGWLRAHIADLDERVVQLHYALDQLKRRIAPTGAFGMGAIPTGDVHHSDSED